MRLPRRPIFQSMLLCSILLRIVVGAPCCLALGEIPAETHHAGHHGEHMAHAEHQPVKEAADSHAGHGEDNRAKPCCSACGPTLPSSDIHFAARTAPPADFTAQDLRDLAPPAPAPAYQATGPPLRV